MQTLYPLSWDQDPLRGKSVLQIFWHCSFFATYRCSVVCFIESSHLLRMNIFQQFHLFGNFCTFYKAFSQYFYQQQKVNLYFPKVGFLLSSFDFWFPHCASLQCTAIAISTIIGITTTDLHVLRPAWAFPLFFTGREQIKQHYLVYQEYIQQRSYKNITHLFKRNNTKLNVFNYIIQQVKLFNCTLWISAPRDDSLWGITNLHLLSTNHQR